MKNKNIYIQLKERVGRECKETIWDNAKAIYEQCYDKKYLKTFPNQQAFAEYLGITKGRISQYRYAYEYFLLYQSQIDLRYLSVEQVYTFHRYIGSSLLNFIRWVQNEKKLPLERISFNDTKKIINEYLNLTKNVSVDITSYNINDIILTEQEKKIIHFYRKPFFVNI